jgi:integrase
MSQELQADLRLHGSDHTDRARAAAQRDYLQYVGDSKKGDLSGWIHNMKARGLAVNTIRQRVSLVRKWLTSPDHVALPSRNNLHSGTWLTRDQLQALLAVIPKSKNGRLDFALVAMILVTGYKLHKIRALRWNDFHESSAKSVVSASRVPQVVLNAIEMIQPTAEDSHPTTVMTSNSTKGSEYIFTAFFPRSPMARSQHFSLDGKKQPLSHQEINRRLKRYARLAGLDPEWISSETLRRTQKELGKVTVTTLVEEACTSRKTGPVGWKRLDRDKRLHGIGRRRR